MDRISDFINCYFIDNEFIDQNIHNNNLINNKNFTLSNVFDNRLSKNNKIISNNNLVISKINSIDIQKQINYNNNSDNDNSNLNKEIDDLHNSISGKFIDNSSLINKNELNAQINESLLNNKNSKNYILNKDLSNIISIENASQFSINIIKENNNSSKIKLKKTKKIYKFNSTPYSNGKKKCSNNFSNSIRDKDSDIKEVGTVHRFSNDNNSIIYNIKEDVQNIDLNNLVKINNDNNNKIISLINDNIIQTNNNGLHDNNLLYYTNYNCNNYYKDFKIIDKHNDFDINYINKDNFNLYNDYNICKTLKYISYKDIENINNKFFDNRKSLQELYDEIKLELSKILK